MWFIPQSLRVVTGLIYKGVNMDVQQLDNLELEATLEQVLMEMEHRGLTPDVTVIEPDTTFLEAWMWVCLGVGVGFLLYGIFSG